jgi:hypothetical protein
MGRDKENSSSLVTRCLVTSLTFGTWSGYLLATNLDSKALQYNSTYLLAETSQEKSALIPRSIKVRFEKHWF